MPSPAVCVLTYNAFCSLRAELLERTLRSVQIVFGQSCALFLLDNGSNDGTSEYVLNETSWWGGTAGVSSTEIHSPGGGRNMLAQIAGVDERPWVVMSDDDMVWSGAAVHALQQLWDHAPDDLVLVSGLLEPEYPWSRPLGVIDCGGIKVLERESVPAAAWSFRGRDWERIGPLKTVLDDEGEDFAACKSLRAMGLRVGAVDLAQHVGAGYSQLGNDEARGLVGRPIDKEQWGLWP